MQATSCHPHAVYAPGVQPREIESEHATARMSSSRSPQDETFPSHQIWDFAYTLPDQYALSSTSPPLASLANRLICCSPSTCARRPSPQEQKVGNVAYFELLTARDSPFSAATRAVIVTEAGHIEPAYTYPGGMALMDQSDLEHNTHIAALAGTRSVLVSGSGSMRSHGPPDLWPPLIPPAVAPSVLPDVPIRARAGDAECGGYCARAYCHLLALPHEGCATC